MSLAAPYPAHAKNHAMTRVMNRTLTPVSAPDRASAVADGDRLLRSVLFLAVILLAFFTLLPFPDLGDPQLLAPKTNGDLLNQAATVLVTGALATFVFVKRTSLLLRGVTLPLILTLLAFAISAVLSSYADVAERRVILAMLTIFQAAVLIILPCGREHFARLLGIAAIVILAACYFGVAFLPNLSVHQLTDIAEPGLAGDWRGFFTHKNGAGASMALLVFIGIFVYRTVNRATGIGIAALAFVFLYFTHAKSPLNLLPIVLLLSYLIPRVRNSFIALALTLAVPVVINLLTVGSVMFEPIANLVNAVMADPTYTGRTVIWRFALDNIAQRPLFGFGFEAFWGMPNLVDNWNYLESWGYVASDAHNSFLNLAVTTGLVGLALSLWWIVVQPFIDLRRGLARGADPALTTLFLQIWLLGLCLSGFESEFFRGGSGLWFLMVVAIIGFRFLAIARSRE